MIWEEEEEEEKERPYKDLSEVRHGLVSADCEYMGTVDSRG